MSIFVFILDAIFCGTSFFCVASEEIVMCSFLLHSSILVTKRSLQKQICAAVIFV